MLAADYLIIGAGAVGMTFADEVLSGSDRATLVMVDRRAAPGGHWHDAYPYVRLHQPSAFYGAGSRRLGGERVDAAGPNAGLLEMATGAEVLAYFDALMRERFLPSGRVTFLPKSEHRGEGRVVSLATGEETRVAARKIVDATWYNTSVPATHRRRFAVDGGVDVIAPNALPLRAREARRFVILGGGKTGMDAVVFLLEAGVEPERMRWVIPRAMWAINRALVQPARLQEHQALQLEAAAGAADADELWGRLEAAGVMLRLHRDVRPETYRGATLAPAEAEMLGRISDVVRLGRVKRLRADTIELERGEAPARADDLYIDCTASAINPGPPTPVFQGDRITLQTVRPNLVSLSAAIIGRAETAYDDDAVKNELCAPAPVDRTAEGMPATMLAGLRAAERWSRDKTLRAWLAGHRLSGAGFPGPDAETVADLRRRIEAARPAAIASLERMAGVVA